ncbi:MAG: DUF732 domain-containing protein, partial [bacterium]|nr:DUF732 domain-containing protein [bacterium]
MAALSLSRTLRIAFWLLAAMALLAACGSDAPPSPTTPVATSSAGAPASSAPTGQSTAEHSAEPTTAPPTAERTPALEPLPPSPTPIGTSAPVSP